MYPPKSWMKRDRPQSADRCSICDGDMPCTLLENLLLCTNCWCDYYELNPKFRIKLQNDATPKESDKLRPL